MDFWRQQDIIDLERLNRQPFTLIGAGGIGSYVAATLAKMGVTDLTVYDPDLVEDHNLPNQNYRIRDVGRPKVEALAEILADFTGLQIKPHVALFPLTMRPQGIVISALDSMQARKQIWDSCLKNNFQVDAYLEARMGAEQGRIYTLTNVVDPRQVGYYEARFYSDADAAQEPCTARAVAYNVFYLAGALVSRVKKVVMDQPVEIEHLFDLASGVTLTLAAR
jgi:hypothetical protein